MLYEPEKSGNVMANFGNVWQCSAKVCYNEEIDKYETTGLHKQPEKTVGDSLFWQLQERPHAKELWDYNYPFEKLLGMWMQPRYMDMANSLLEELKPFWEKYVCFEPNMKPIEISILLTIACHFYKLDHDENYKNDIPDTDEYR